jgi:hypothetical protein
VSEQWVYNWETKKATPRKEQLAAIIGMREVGKREVQRLDASNRRGAQDEAEITRSPLGLWLPVQSHHMMHLVETTAEYDLIVVLTFVRAYIHSAAGHAIKSIAALVGGDER